MARLQEEFVRKMRTGHYALNTERSYWHWIKRFILFNQKRHPRDMSEVEVGAFLSYLATHENISQSTQRQVLSSLVFLYRCVIGKELVIEDWVKPNKPKRLPVVLTVKEVNALLDEMEDPYLTMAQLMYGAGLRVTEVLRLRIKDVDFDRNEIIVRQGKGAKDRMTMLPQGAKLGLKIKVVTIFIYGAFKKRLRRRCWRHKSINMPVAIRYGILLRHIY
jgi:site-specific recombinase XerD